MSTTHPKRKYPKRRVCTGFRQRNVDQGCVCVCVCVCGGDGHLPVAKSNKAEHSEQHIGAATTKNFGEHQTLRPLSLTAVTEDMAPQQLKTAKFKRC
mmetsp:Transcript_27671/g.54498  ORF Transcript_27671/g.54498 Transcript_27671/m.54498 type:complete len:97 (-) Transcript_27671:37-327(-)